MHDSSGRSTPSPRAPGQPVSPDALHLRPDHPEDVPFLLARTPQRMGRALLSSMIGQAVLFVTVVYLANSFPRANVSTPALPDIRNYDIVWLPQEGPGGGGGGGGNESPEPPRKAELPGRDRLTLPVARPPDVVQPPKKETPEPPPIEQLSIPALAMAQGLETLPGALEGVSPSDSLGPGSGGGAGTGRGTGIGPGDGSGLGPGSGGGTGGGIYRPGSGVTIPRPIREVKPQYTSEAMRAKIQGEVWLEAVVLPDGSVGHVDIVRSLDAVFGLDQEAVKAARQWRFVPGTRLGEPVPVLVTISMTFTLR
jgi:protein TonB